jgi:hypothetical protein
MPVHFLLGKRKGTSLDSKIIEINPFPVKPLFSIETWSIGVVKLQLSVFQSSFLSGTED